MIIISSHKDLLFLKNCIFDFYKVTRILDSFVTNFFYPILRCGFIILKKGKIKLNLSGILVNWLIISTTNKQKLFSLLFFFTISNYKKRQLRIFINE